MALVKSPPGVLSFPYLKEADENGKYRGSLIYGKNADLSVLENAIQAAAEAKFGKGKVPKKIKWPIHSNEGVVDRDGNIRTGYEDQEGRHIKFWTRDKPQLVGTERDGQGRLIDLDQSEFYPGAICRISFSVWCGTHATGGPAACIMLANIQKLEDGTRLSGFSSDPNDDFADDAEVQAAIS